MAQCSTALAALAEYPASIPSTCTAANNICTSVLGDLVHSSGPHGHQVHTYIYIYI